MARHSALGFRDLSFHDAGHCNIFDNIENVPVNVAKSLQMHLHV